MAKQTIVELEQLRDRLREAEETLAAIRHGEVDSLVVTGPNGDQVFSLRGAEQPYRIFVEQMLEGAVTLSDDGIILYCNRRFAEMVRSPLEKVIGSQFRSFLRAADHPELKQILENPNGVKARYVLEATDGSLIASQLAFRRLPAEEVCAICVVVTDLTEQQEKQDLTVALQKLRAAQELLQHQNEALIRARVEAESASEAKDNFLAALSHELRTPLTPVLMTAAAMEADPSLPDQLREDLAVIRRNVELEARLIDDLLDLTRIVRGKLDFRPRVSDVHAILSDALDICRGDITAKKMRLTQRLDAKESHINADAVRVQQILWNLVRNAVKFTPEHGRIDIRTRNAEGKVIIEISDNGMGIDAEAMRRIFSPFEQAGRTISQRFGGLGLGLAISKRLAELHGGSLDAHSDGADRGSTFTLALPTVLAPSEVQAKTGPTTRENTPRQLRILLVEDHDDTRRGLVRFLGQRHTVRDVSNIEAALSAVGNEGFDLVISDVGLPDGSGLELMRSLRDRYKLQGICLSGFGMEDDIARSTEAGFRHHLTKPIDLSKLEAVIDSFAD